MQSIQHKTMIFSDQLQILWSIKNESIMLQLNYTQQQAPKNHMFIL
jgi:hypothetical protein